MGRWVVHTFINDPIHPRMQRKGIYKLQPDPPPSPNLKQPPTSPKLKVFNVAYTSHQHSNLVFNLFVQLLLCLVWFGFADI